VDALIWPRFHEVFALNVNSIHTFQVCSCSFVACLIA
jgi:hypothetical protein